MATGVHAIPVWLGAVCLSIAVCSSGCGSSGGGSERGEGPEPQPRDVPTALRGIEGEAETAYDKALMLDLAGVDAAARAIVDSWQSYKVEAIGAGADAATVQGMDASVAAFGNLAAASHDHLALARAANGVSAWMGALFSLYAEPVPPDVIELDYRGREMVLDALLPDLTAAADDLAALDGIWRRVRPLVESAGGGTEAAEFATGIDAVHAAISAGNAQRTVAATNSLLERVDLLEGVFAP